jgi:putative holliday junction resolvase
MSRILAIDYGKTRSGIAISDETKSLAKALKVTIGLDGLKKEMDVLFQTYEIEKIVIGVSNHADGSIGEIGKLSKSFAIYLQNKFGIKVELYDEAMTTKEVERRFRELGRPLKRYKHEIDKYAAEMILQEYLMQI